MGFAQQKELESQYLMSTFGRKPVELVSGSGMEAFDDEGNAYLDFIGGIGVLSLGHCHPQVVAAIEDQAEKLMHVSNYYYIENRGEVAKTVSELLNEGADEASRTPWKSFFANSGAEANECAIKLARLHARRRAGAAAREAGADETSVAAAEYAAPRLIVTLEGSFHGRTLASLAATAQPAKQEAFQPLPAGFTATPINDVEALERLFETQGDRICAVMIECIQGESGVHPCTEEFVGAIRRLTEEHGALMICDEVQSGIFRTGLPYGFQNFGVLPDIVTMAKGIASGVVAGACAAKSSIAAAFAPGDHGTTFGGSNIAVAAAHVTLSTLLAPGMGAQIESVGAYMRERLARLPHVQEVRGFGLMNGIDLTHEAPSAPDVVAAGLEAGLVLNATGPHTLRFLPPLICTEADVDVLVQKLEQLL